MHFTGKTIVITGASDGIGAELARQLAVERPNLVVAARGAEALERVAADCRARGAQAIAVPTDVADPLACEQLIARAAQAFGGIDVLVNNAGISMHAMFDEITDFSTFERLYRINALSCVHLARHALPHLKARRGLLVGVSSLAGKTGVPGRTVYCMSKFAMSGFFEALRIELDGSGVDVTMVFPGVVATEIRRRGWNGAGEPAGVSGLEERGAMSVDACARQIVQAMRTRRREWVMTPKARLGLWLKLVAPALVDRMARNALRRP
ncbi:MAG: SDR family oxidoreductase [Burkholderiaceae bacterium]|jgi:short-subunit dehydrogenase|nr:SDR family oxidoreductase [Burkholderiaceae bacterium]